MLINLPGISIEEFASTLSTIAFELKRREAGGEWGKELRSFDVDPWPSPNRMPDTGKEARHQQP
jgi:hypothetical protein